MLSMMMTTMTVENIEAGAQFVQQPLKPNRRYAILSTCRFVKSQNKYMGG
jgi:hypothetical protein